MLYMVRNRDGVKKVGIYRWLYIDDPAPHKVARGGARAKHPKPQTILEYNSCERRVRTALRHTFETYFEISPNKSDTLRIRMAYTV
jgi:hypothetical protein